MEHIKYAKQFLDYRPIWIKRGQTWKRLLNEYNSEAETVNFSYLASWPKEDILLIIHMF